MEEALLKKIQQNGLRAWKLSWNYKTEYFYFELILKENNEVLENKKGAVIKQLPN